MYGGVSPAKRRACSLAPACWLLGLILAGPCFAVTVSQSGDVLAISTDRTRIEYHPSTGLFDGYLLRGERFLKDARAWVVADGKEYVTTAGYRRTFRTERVTDAAGRGRELVLQHSDLPGAPDLTLRLRMYERRNLLLCRLEVTAPPGKGLRLERSAVLDGVVNLSSEPEELRFLANVGPGGHWTDIQIPDVWEGRRVWETSSHLVAGVANPETRQGIAVGCAGAATPGLVRLGFQPERDPRNPWVTVLADYGAEAAGGPTSISLEPKGRWTSDWALLTTPKNALTALSEFGLFFRGLNGVRTRPVPTGWTSRDSAGGAVTQDFVLRNADVVARELKPYGATLVQVDLGPPQDAGVPLDGPPENRFPQGMAWLASEIRGLGLTPGLRVAPLGGDGQPASSPDLSLPASRQWLAQAEERLGRQWGFGYLRADSLGAAGASASGQHFHTLYREAAARLRQSLGRQGFLVGGAGYEWKTAGLVDAQRAGPEVEPRWEGIYPSACLAARRYFAHGNLWLYDPDAVIVGEPLTLEQARAWATLAAFSGGSVLSGDDLTQLSPERMRLLKSILPAYGKAARPLDLFEPAPGLGPKYPRVWHLPHTLGGAGRHLVALFNWSASEPERVGFDLPSLGIGAQQPVLIYDFWSQRLLGEFRGSFEAELSPGSTRVLVVQPRMQRPFVLSTNRHVLQGAVELKGLRWNPTTRTLSGRVAQVPDQATTLVVYVPAGWKLLGARGPARPLAAARQGSLLRLEVPAGRGDFSWLARFRAPRRVTSRPAASRSPGPVLGSLRVRRGPGALPSTDGMALASAAEEGSPEVDLLAEAPLWHEGSFDGEGPSVRRVGLALAVSAPAVVAYEAPQGYARLRGRVRVDDQDVELLFRVLGEGRVLWESGPLGRGQSASLDVPLEGAREIRLVVHNLRGEYSLARGQWSELRLLP